MATTKTRFNSNDPTDRLHPPCQWPPSATLSANGCGPQSPGPLKGRRKSWSEKWLVSLGLWVKTICLTLAACFAASTSECSGPWNNLEVSNFAHLDAILHGAKKHVYIVDTAGMDDQHWSKQAHKNGDFEGNNLQNWHWLMHHQSGSCLFGTSLIHHNRHSYFVGSLLWSIPKEASFWPRFTFTEGSLAMIPLPARWNGQDKGRAKELFIADLPMKMPNTHRHFTNPYKYNYKLYNTL